MAKTQWRKGLPLAENLQDRLRHLVRERGEKKVSEMLGIAVISVTRAALGCGTREGTRILIETRLGALDGVDDAKKVA